MKPEFNWLEYYRLELISPSKLEPRHSQLTFRCGLENIWQFLLKHLFQSPKLQVWYTCDHDGKIWWSAHNRLTGKSICQISEEQMRVWIEGQYR